jgi:hypothetical protein
MLSELDERGDIPAIAQLQEELRAEFERNFARVFPITRVIAKEACARVPSMHWKASLSGRSTHDSLSGACGVTYPD